MKIKGNRTRKVYNPEHKAVEVQLKCDFIEPYNTQPSIYTDSDVNVTLDQSEAPYTSVTVKGVLTGDVVFGEGTKEVEKPFSLEIKGYH